MNLISFDVYFMSDGAKPVVINLPPSAALEVVSFSSSNVLKLVPNYGLSSVPVDTNKE